jgi:pimeloyl-ACP methyl ester carboxylesterase
VLLHGAGGDHRAWDHVATLLADRFRLHAVDRAPGAGFTAEARAVARTVERLGSPVVVVGHSGGAVVGLEAALLTDVISRMVLYEPPVLAGAAPFRDDTLRRAMRALLAQGRRDDAAALFLRGAAGLGEQDLARMRRSARWPALAERAPGLLDALDASIRYRFRPERFAHLRTPALLLLGEHSSTLHRTSVTALLHALPSGSLAELPGQRHQAISTAPSLLVETILPFLLAGPDDLDGQPSSSSSSR